jgi:hypothetical protein
VLCFYVLGVWDEGFGFWMVFLFIMGLALSCGGVGNLASFRKLEIRRSECALHFGWLLNRKCLTVPKEDLELRIGVAEKGHPFYSLLQYGTVILSLVYENHATINLAYSPNPSAIDTLYRLLLSHFENASDETLAEELLSDGRVVYMAKTGISQCPQAFKSAELLTKEAGRKLIVARSLYVKAFWLGVTAVGVMGIYILTLDQASDKHWVVPIFFGGFLLIIVCGLLGLFPGFGTTFVSFAKDDKTVTVRQGFGGTFFGSRVYSFDNVVGVQICPRYVSDGDNSDYTVFEVNLVCLSDDKMERVHIMSDRDQNKIFSHAKLTASFVEVGLFDHR